MLEIDAGDCLFVMPFDGIAPAHLAARVLRTLMFGITETDPLTLVVTVVVFACVGFGAGFIPARRAASVDPVVALRSE